LNPAYKKTPLDKNHQSAKRLLILGCAITYKLKSQNSFKRSPKLNFTIYFLNWSQIILKNIALEYQILASTNYLQHNLNLQECISKYLLFKHLGE
jgi:hypothetical protein